ncbi:MAG: hypothetical protein Q7R40_18000 [Phaeospirillum sp.]|nr:hypothetical protein [Phaeospirillum sp.]
MIIQPTTLSANILGAPGYLAAHASTIIYSEEALAEAQGVAAGIAATAVIDYRDTNFLRLDIVRLAIGEAAHLHLLDVAHDLEAIPADRFAAAAAKVLGQLSAGTLRIGDRQATKKYCQAMLSSGLVPDIVDQQFHLVAENRIVASGSGWEDAKADILYGSQILVSGIYPPWSSMWDDPRTEIPWMLFWGQSDGESDEGDLGGEGDISPVDDFDGDVEANFMQPEGSQR